MRKKNWPKKLIKNIFKEPSSKDIIKRRKLILLICSIYSIAVFVLYCTSHILIKFTNSIILEWILWFSDKNKNVLFLAPICGIMLWLERDKFIRK